MLVFIENWQIGDGPTMNGGARKFQDSKNQNQKKMIEIH